MGCLFGREFDSLRLHKNLCKVLILQGFLFLGDVFVVQNLISTDFNSNLYQKWSVALLLNRLLLFFTDLPLNSNPGTLGITLSIVVL